MLIETTLAFALALAPDGRPWERARVVETLQNLMKTGEPRHIDHDEGQELWATLSMLLQNGSDPELQALATRAACPIVVRVHRPLDTIDGAELEVTTRCVLPLRSPVAYRATVEANLDGAGWRTLIEVRPGGSYGSKLNRTLRRDELRQGFTASTFVRGFRTSNRWQECLRAKSAIFRRSRSGWKMPHTRLRPAHKKLQRQSSEDAPFT